MFTVADRLYRTASGRLVRESDPAAAFLAYPPGTEVSDEEAKRSGLTEFYRPATEASADEKAAPPAQNKVGATRPNKAKASDSPS